MFLVGMVCLFLYPSAGLLDQTWLGVWVTRNGNLGHYYFHIAGLFRGQNRPVDPVTVAALLKYD